MASEGSPDPEPVRARKVPREDARPQSVVERQASLSAYLIRRSQRRRDRFLRRSRTTTIGSELLRAGYLTGCILLDFLIIPEPIFLIGGDVGWAITIVAFFFAIGVEGWFYSKHFALKEEDEESGAKEEAVSGAEIPPGAPPPEQPEGPVLRREP